MDLNPILSRIAVKVLLLAMILSSSCASYKRISYFKDAPNAKTIALGESVEPRIKPNDILQISVHTIGAESQSLTGVSNALMTSSTSANSYPGNGAIQGFLVDRNGDIEMPLIGVVKVGGKTTAEIKQLIKAKEEDFFKDPIVNVRLSNFAVSVLGEVNKPGQYIVSNEKISVIDAISMAGDLTAYGKRNNILLIHDQGGKKEYVRFNLNSTKIFDEPLFYLQPGDIIYVQPNRSKAAASDVTLTRNIAILSSITTIVAIIMTNIKP